MDILKRQQAQKKKEREEFRIHTWEQQQHIGRVKMATTRASNNYTLNTLKPKHIFNCYKLFVA